MLRYRVPGRINLIGEHTDYNEGFVLPGAVDLGIDFFIEFSEESNHFFYSTNFNESSEVSSDGSSYEKSWARYFAQVVQVLRSKNLLRSNISCQFGGNLPVGAGMSSSSALACGLIYGLNHLENMGLSSIEIVRIASVAENGTGLQGGLMDQFSIVHGRKDMLLFIDCKDMSHREIAFKPEGYELVLIDTKVEHSLVETEYNSRKNDCDQGLSILKTYNPLLNSVRDISFEEMKKHGKHLSEVQHMRLSYILDENQRVLDMVQAIQKNDCLKIGELLYRSHEGLKSCYQVSCLELDFIVDWTKSYKEILGCRMMGGGFGGCTIALIKKDAILDLFPDLVTVYQEVFGLTPTYYIVNLCDGIRHHMANALIDG